MQDFELERRQDADGLVIVFDNPTVSGDYGAKRLMRKNRQSVLYVNTHRKLANSGSLDELLNRITPAVGKIRSAIRQVNPKKVGTFGVSLAAFPALHVGAMLGADVVAALCPETLIGMPGTRSALRLKNAQTTFPHPDIQKTFKRMAPKATHIYIGEEDFTDVQSAWRLRDLSGVNLHSLEGVGHAVLREFTSDGFIFELLGRMLDEDFDFSSHPKRGNLTNSPEAVDAWCAGHGLLNEDKTIKAADELRRASENFPDNPALLFDLGRALLRQRLYGAAVAALDAAAKKQPLNRQFSELLARAQERNARYSASTAATDSSAGNDTTA